MRPKERERGIERKETETERETQRERKREEVECEREKRDRESNRRVLSKLDEAKLRLRPSQEKKKDRERGEKSPHSFSVRMSLERRGINGP